MASENSETTIRNSILIVDDDKFDLLALYKALSPNYSIYLSKYGDEAVRLAVESKPDLIMLDIMMPDMSGFDVLSKLQAAVETNNIPVMFLTGLDSRLYEERGLLLGAVDYITKPFQINIVKARVHAHMRMISKLKENELLGLTDALTELPNRRGLNARAIVEIKRAVREKYPVSFLYIDVDFFKKYNDYYGHPQGDAALKSIAAALKRSAKRPSDYCVRLGGEEFGILLPDTDLAGAVKVAERLRGEVARIDIPTLDFTAVTKITLSIGVATAFPESEADLDELMSRADKNLYKAKCGGRN